MPWFWYFRTVGIGTPPPCCVDDAPFTTCCAAGTPTAHGEIVVPLRRPGSLAPAAATPAYVESDPFTTADYRRKATR